MNFCPLFAGSTNFLTADISHTFCDILSKLDENWHGYGCDKLTLVSRISRTMVRGSATPCAVLHQWRTVVVSVLSLCPVCDVGVSWWKGWMDHDATWYGGRPAPLTERGTAPPLFGPCLLRPNGRPSQQLLSFCWLSYLRNIQWRFFGPQRIIQICGQNEQYDCNLLLPPPRRICFCRCLFVCLFVC